jgi:opacity protein-like surface antigen
MMRKLLVTAAAVIVTTMAAFASDVSGKWTAQVPSRDGQMREQTFTFKVDGEKLTGTVSGMQGDIEIKDGTVKGDDIAFSVVRAFQGNEVKINYKGKVAGSEIKFTSQREGGDRTQEFVAKKATS